ncbi:hypothetical protein NIASO_06625 [Niabella soli DSM 19437]|uniref:Uncharacterized protein n=1 Tax=Niabella soli DSM 19437 TaxID=929713 RepID=W0F6F0_9BACT|nr:hypothetical protein NIASO_06625 [Niabella soli DSM 19437]
MPVIRIAKNNKSSVLFRIYFLKLFPVKAVFLYFFIHCPVFING